jgi:hydrogenase maturation protease
MKSILIAGIGNIFNGDDAFGVYVARQLQGVKLPKGVQVLDFGIRSYDLAYAIGDGYHAVIFVDATARGGAPGTLYQFELDPLKLEAANTVINGHSLNPVAVLQLAQASGVNVGRLFLVGCEPKVLDNPGGDFGLSANVQAAVPEAVNMIVSLAENLLEEKQEQENAGCLPA